MLFWNTAHADDCLGLGRVKPESRLRGICRKSATTQLQKLWLSIDIEARGTTTDTPRARPHDASCVSRAKAETRMRVPAITW